MLNQDRGDPLPPVIRSDIEVLQLAVAIEPGGCVSGYLSDDSIALDRDETRAGHQCLLRMVLSLEV